MKINRIKIIFYLKIIFIFKNYTNTLENILNKNKKIEAISKKNLDLLHSGKIIEINDENKKLENIQELCLKFIQIVNKNKEKKIDDILKELELKSTYTTYRYQLQEYLLNLLIIYNIILSYMCLLAFSNNYIKNLINLFLKDKDKNKDKDENKIKEIKNIQNHFYIINGKINMLKSSSIFTNFRFKTLLEILKDSKEFKNSINNYENKNGIIQIKKINPNDYFNFSEKINFNVDYHYKIVKDILDYNNKLLVEPINNSKIKENEIEKKTTNTDKAFIDKKNVGISLAGAAGLGALAAIINKQYNNYKKNNIRNGKQLKEVNFKNFIKNSLKNVF